MPIILTRIEGDTVTTADFLPALPCGSCHSYDENAWNLQFADSREGMVQMGCGSGWLPLEEADSWSWASRLVHTRDSGETWDLWKGPLPPWYTAVTPPGYEAEGVARTRFENRWRIERLERAGAFACELRFQPARGPSRVIERWTCPSAR